MKWEYLLVELEQSSFETQANALGSDGWELAHADVKYSSMIEERVYHCIFKRQLRA